MSRLYDLRVDIRHKYGSEAELARTLGMSKQTLNNYLSGKRKPPIDVVLKLSDALETTVREIIQIFLEQRSPNGVQKQIV